MERYNEQNIRLPELVKYIDRILNSKEKRSLLDIIESLEKEYELEQQAEGSHEVVSKDLSEKLVEENRETSAFIPDKLQTILKACESKDNGNFSDEKPQYNNKDTSIKPDNKERRLSFLPNIEPSSPARPTELLCRLLDRANKMKPEIFIPSMPLASASTRCSFGESSTTSPRKNASNFIDNKRTRSVPRFNYNHDDGPRRNLPGEPELIRLLTEPEMHLGGASDANGGKENAQNTWLSLYGGTMGPPLIDKTREKGNKRRKMLCKYCRRSPGDHQKWCVYYTDIREFNEPKGKLVRSFTDDDLDLHSNDDDTASNNIDMKRSKTTLDDSTLKRNLPDYSTLHRDVYIQALADTQARLIMKNTRDFMQQTTKPFVFSYFQTGDDNKRNRITDEMKHIFGKNHSDFTKYYKRLCKPEL